MDLCHNFLLELPILTFDQKTMTCVHYFEIYSIGLTLIEKVETKFVKAFIAKKGWEYHF